MIWCVSIKQHIIYNYFDAKFFIPRSFDNVSQSFCSFDVIATNLVAALNSPVGINFHIRFPYGSINSVIYSSSYSATNF